MLTLADTERLQQLKCLYLEWCEDGDNSKIEKVADMLVNCDDPQMVWNEHVLWGEKLTGVPCPNDCRDITHTVRIKQRLQGRLN